VACPYTVKETQAFLGFCNFYRRFIANYSAIARPLFDLTLERHCFHGPLHIKLRFAALISQFTQALSLPCLTTPQPFRLITDASVFATALFLEQPDLLIVAPVAYFSSHSSLQSVITLFMIKNSLPLSVLLRLPPLS